MAKKDLELKKLDICEDVYRKIEEFAKETNRNLPDTVDFLVKEMRRSSQKQMTLSPENTGDNLD